MNKASGRKGGDMAKNSKKTESKTTIPKTTATASKVVSDGRTSAYSKTAAGSALSQASAKSSGSVRNSKSSARAETDKDILRANRSLSKAVTAIRNSRSQ